MRPSYTPAQSCDFHTLRSTLPAFPNSEPNDLLTFANAVCLPALTAIRFNIPNILIDTSGDPLSNYVSSVDTNKDSSWSMLHPKKKKSPVLTKEVDPIFPWRLTSLP